MIKIYNFLSFEQFDVNKIISWIEKYKTVVIIINTYKINKQIRDLNYLNMTQIKKMNFYHKENDQNNYYISHGIVNEIFSCITGCTKKNIIWSYEKYEKPYIKNIKNYKFNITHTKGCTAIALSRNDIGIDIEYLDKNFNYEDIIKYSFSEKEASCIQSRKNFYTYWVVKEAYLKYKGVGLFQELNSIEVIMSYDEKILLYDAQEKIIKLVKIENIFMDYIMSICV